MTDNQYVVFKTPTLLDLRAITTFGLNAKPNSKSPIGYFGTGLKMAIAVLLRNSIAVRLFIGDTEYEFVQQLDDFRGTEFTKLGFRKRKGLLARWSYTELPFTTQLARNWSLWQAFRELESNTRDEQGMSSVHMDGPSADYGTISGWGDQTVFIIGPSVEFAKVYEERDKIFLPQALKTFEYGDANIQLFKEPSNHIYYRGIRVADLDKPSIFTYNILQTIELSEDRTIKYMFYVEEYIRRFLSESEDRGLINQLLNATEKHWESKLDWDSSLNNKPTAVFLDAVARRVRKERYIAGNSGGYVPLLSRFSSMHSTYSPPPTVEPLSNKLNEWVQLKRPDLSEVEVDLLEEVVTKMRMHNL